MRRLLVTVPAVVALTIALAAAPAGAASDSSAARKIPLTSRDLKGWKSTGQGSSDDSTVRDALARCERTRRLSKPTARTSRSFDNRKVSLDQTVYVWKSEKTAKAFVGLYTSKRYAKCAPGILRRQATADPSLGITVEDASIRPLHQIKLGEQRIAYGAVVTVKEKATSRRQDIVFINVVIRRGRTTTVLVFQHGSAGDVNEKVEQAISRKADARLGRYAKH